ISETPPGHWFAIFNYVADHALTVKRIGGIGPVVNNLEWDVKGYLALGGAMHDCAISAWGVKGWYDFVRPVSAIRYMADRYAQNPSDPDAITLHPGLIEVITTATTAPGQHHEHLLGYEGRIAIKAWRGPNYIINPATDVAGVGWILAQNWWPYQRPTFVSPPFAGYVSGHSTYSRAASVVLDRFTGSPWFPGGLGEFVCPQNNFLVFEKGPSVTVKLQWASYYDASDQTSLSRIWGGIHPPADDIPGRVMGQQIGNDAVDRARMYWAGSVPALASYSTYGTGCFGASGNAVAISGVPGARAVIGSTLRVEVANLPVSTPAVIMMVGTTAIVPGTDLGMLGAPGCTLDLGIIDYHPLTPLLGHATWSLPIPNDPTWLGQSIYHQAAAADALANPFGWTTSNAGNAIVGL
ncbi:MAG: vanadium-dependent haloperoxidase, partial [Planctomycetota bacterium]